MRGCHFGSALVKARAVIGGMLAISLVSTICFPAAGLAVEGASGGGADESKPVATEIDPADSDGDTEASADTSDGDADAADDTPSGEEAAPQVNPSFTMSMKRVTAAPADTDEFFIDPDGPALTWDEFADKYLVDEDNDDDDEDDEGEDEGDWEEDEDAAPDLEDNGWYLDIDEFRWYYCADDGEDYAEGSIPAEYLASAEADGLDFGRLHDSDFGGIWYFSKSDGRWHFIDCYGKDHAKPSPAFLEEQYNRFADEADSDDEGGDGDGDEGDDPDDDSDVADDEDDADDVDSDDDEGDDEGDEDDGEDADVTEWYWDEKYWEDRIVGYGFGQGDNIVYEVTIANTGDTALTMGLENAFADTPTDPAVGGLYPLDGSGTHPATTMAASAEGDGPVDDAIEEEEIVGEVSPSIFADPVVDSVEGDGVVWNNMEESKGTTVMPNITVEPGSSAIVRLTVSVSGNTAEVLAATPDSGDCGYAATTSSVDAAASVPAPAEADSPSEGDGQVAGGMGAQSDGDSDAVMEEAEESVPGEEGSLSEGDSPAEAVKVADQSASAYAPTRATYYTNYLRNSAVLGKAADAQVGTRGAKAWKAHRDHAATKAAPATTMPKAGDDASRIVVAVALLACASLLICLSRVRLLRQ